MERVALHLVNTLEVMVLVKMSGKGSDARLPEDRVIVDRLAQGAVVLMAQQEMEVDSAGIMRDVVGKTAGRLAMFFNPRLR
jgi:hypothetical protein